MVTWARSGGREASHALRLDAIKEAQQQRGGVGFGATDQLFEEAGDSLAPYLAHCQSLCATPAFLWDALSDTA